MRLTVCCGSLRRLPAGFAALLLLVPGIFPAAWAQTPTATEIRQSWLKHAARAQLHRWFQVYERPASGIDNALDALSETFFFTADGDGSRGRDAYRDRLATIPEHWQNASIVNASTVRVLDEFSLEMDAEVTFLNQGMRSDGSVRAAELAFETRLERGDEILPVFNQIAIEQTSEGTPAGYQDAYARNRLLSLVHYFFAVIEHPAHDPQPAFELLARSFRLELANGSINSYPTFAAWLRGPAARATASSYRLNDFTFDTLAEDERYVLGIEVDWYALQPDGTRLHGRNWQSWTVVNDVSERFARIESIEEDVLEPLAVSGD